MTKSIMKLSLLGSLALSSVACEFHARGAEDYRDVTQALLDTKKAEIEACYNTALQGQSSLSGRVTVQFTVEAETGRLKDVRVDPAGTTAPETLSACVTNAISALALTPPDARDGIATWVYDFTPTAG